MATGPASVPLLGAKLWSVCPRLFTWPPARDVVNAIERASNAALVAASLFQLGGEAFPPDHGYPARLIAPTRPGVMPTTWMSRIVARNAP